MPNDKAAQVKELATLLDAKIIISDLADAVEVLQTRLAETGRESATYHDKGVDLQDALERWIGLARDRTIEIRVLQSRLEKAETLINQICAVTVDVPMDRGDPDYMAWDSSALRKVVEAYRRKEGKES